MSDFITIGGQLRQWFPTELPVELESVIGEMPNTTCPHCKGARVIHVDAVTAGNPQPPEELPCPLCNAVGDVAASTAALYKAEGLEGVLAARKRAEDCDAVGVKYPF